MCIYKRSIYSFCVILSLLFCILMTASADGDKNVQVTKPTAIPVLTANDIKAKSVVLMESTTSQLLVGKNSEDKINPQHFSKLMTALLAAEAIEKGDLTLDSMLVTSKHANSMGGSQIWLNVGEKISVLELIKSITIGNANDACVVLAEGIAGTEEEFVKMMNVKADELGMKSTVFSDCTGIDVENQHTTPIDLAFLATAVLNETSLSEYFTTRMDTVRDGKTELVSTNILLNGYKGSTGMKASYSESGGHALIATAKKDDMSYICVIIGGKENDEKFAWAKKMLDSAFASYEFYTPEIPQEYLKPVKVAKGENQSVPVKIDEVTSILIPKGSSNDIEIRYNKKAALTAPIDSNTVVGTVDFYTGDTVLLTADVVTEQQVRKISFVIAFGKILKELLVM